MRFGRSSNLAPEFVVVFCAQWSAVALLVWLFHEQRVRDQARRARTRTLKLPQ